MRLVFQPASEELERACEPVTAGRAFGDIPVANRPLSVWQRDRAIKAGLEPVMRGTGAAGRVATVPLSSWLSTKALALLARAGADLCICDLRGRPLAWSGHQAYLPAGIPMHADPESFAIRYPWDILRLHPLAMELMGEPRIEGNLSPHAHSCGQLWLGRGSAVLPGVVIEGPVVVGSECRIGPNCYLRGPTAIGDHCRIGQAVELKNCLIMDHTAIGHLSYVGDSIIGSRVNLGAGTLVANLRHDGRNHRSMVRDCLIDTRRRKLGVIMGDGVHTGIHTTIYPARKLWPGVWTFPGAVIAQDVRAEVAEYSLSPAAV